MRGRVLMGSGHGAGLTARTAGAKVGREQFSKTLSVAEMPAHDHGKVILLFHSLFTFTILIVISLSYLYSLMDDNIAATSGSGSAEFYRIVNVRNNSGAPLHADGKNCANNHVTGWHGGDHTDRTDNNYPVAHHTHPINVANRGGGNAFTEAIIPPSLVIPYIIKY
jgi:microcystin-dependent protein